ncbi:34405_t:CDS:2 [Gigaspora margarita]|uniref:34405_t:CDS:1 n=1 Tax=Gigaspora margarita TaxID=4874 RepID=A0ABN7VHE6_GIGMA|nr:34405_t:CDS:2 [Gigaspora margarita]
MKSLQEYLSKLIPKEENRNIIMIDHVKTVERMKKISGEFENDDGINNELVKLDLSTCRQLEVLSVYGNKFTSLDFLKNDNKYFYSYFDDYSSQNYNHFHGTLEPLQNLPKLKTLNISNADIDNGLEYLSDSIINFYCLVPCKFAGLDDKIIYKQVNVIKEKLETSFEGSCCITPCEKYAIYLSIWKKKNKGLVFKVRPDLFRDY